MAFTPKTWYLLSKKVADVWASLEEEVNIHETLQLAKHYTKGTEDWYKAQIQDLPNFSKKIEEIANKHLAEINEESKTALEKAIELADNETKKAMSEIAGINKDLEFKDDFLAAAMQRFSDFNKGEVSAFISSAVLRNNQFVNNIRVNASNMDKTNIRVKSGMWDHTQGLYDIIRKQTEEGIKYGVPFIYSDGRKVPFKAHMEMSVRTLLQNETSDRMENATKALGIIFFLASEHADCADDHAPYQGKIYVQDNWESVITEPELKEKIREFIRKNKIQTIQWIKGPPAYFTTRPNCRHYFIPISIEQALGNINELKAKLKTKKGDYLEKNYEDLKKQRYNERAIRFYKERVNANTILYEKTTDPQLKSDILKDIQRDQLLVRKWQVKQRQLILSNKNLMREYRREDVNKMAQDFGIEIHNKDLIPYKFKIVENGVVVEKEVKYSKTLLSRNVDEKYRSATLIEPKLTQDIIEITENAGAYNEGLAYKLKNKDSLERKIRDDYVVRKIKNKEVSINDITKNIYDVNRYTAILDVNNFVDQYYKIHNNLLKKGYTLFRSKNTFKLSNVTYKGVNNVYFTKDGKPFELQFHTKESFDLKEKTNHELYEEERKIEISEERKEELRKLQILNSNKLTVPKNIDKI